MALHLKVTNSDGSELEKELDELKSDAEAHDRKLIIMAQSYDVTSCLQLALKRYSNDAKFFNEVNAYRIFRPGKQFQNRYPIMVEFYQ